MSRQHAVCAFGCMLRLDVMSKKNYATFKQGRRLRFGMLIVLTNIRSTKVLQGVSEKSVHFVFLQ